MPGARDRPANRGLGGPHVPLTDIELSVLGAKAFDGLRAAVLAVSGGADSLSLMLMAERWRAATGRRDLPIIVATVDHALRPEARGEAKWVAAQAAARGFPAHVLKWEATRPTSGLQAAAREARYELLVKLIDDLQLPKPCGLLVAHHLDDQAETFLMRLARGSGLDGLAAMTPERALRLSGDVELRRPFLGLGKRTLVSTLSARGWTWIEDPSNADDKFERVRLRKALSQLADLGIDAAAISVSVARLARARAALEEATAQLKRAALRCHDGAYAEIDAAAFDAAPVEIRLRLMQFVLTAFGAGGAPVRMAKVEALVERLSYGAADATLGGCHFERRSDSIKAFREPGRGGLPVVDLKPGEVRFWDNRFRVAHEGGGSGDIEVRAVTAAEWRAILSTRDKHGAGLASAGGDLPRRAALTLPSFWRKGELVAMPHPAVGISGDGQFTAAFVLDRS